MRKKIKILTWILTISLVLNLYSFFELRGLEDRITNNLNNQLMHSFNSTGAEFQSLHRELNEIQQENNWMTYSEFKPNIEKSTPSEIHLDLEWTFREIEKGAHVKLLYRDKEPSEIWEEVIATNVSGSQFSASLVLQPLKDYEYQIVSEGDSIKSSNILDIPTQFYRPNPIRLTGSGSGTSNGKLISLSVSFRQAEPVFYEFNKIKKVKVILQYNDSTEEFPLEKNLVNVPPEWTFEFPQEFFNSPSDLKSFILEVEYENMPSETIDFTREISDMIKEMRN